MLRSARRVLASRLSRENRARFTIRGDRKSIDRARSAVDRCRQIMRTGGCDFTREIGTPHAESCAECCFSFCTGRRAGLAQERGPEFAASTRLVVAAVPQMPSTDDCNDL